MTTENSKKINVVPIFPDKKVVKFMGKVRTVQSFVKGLINDDGLYSEEIFGTEGSQRRMSTFGYVDLGISIVHPLIWKTVTKKSLYGKIIDGTAYVTFDKEVNDFVISDMETGHTGYSYFFKNLPNIKFTVTDSDMGKDNIALYEKFKDHITYDKLLILPAGLREYSIDDRGRIIEVEINEFYAAIISMAGLTQSLSNVTEEDLDGVRLRLQEKVNDLYDYLMGMIDGKHKFINGAFTATNIDYGTRNVASSIPNVIDDLKIVKSDINTSQIGLFQFIKGMVPYVQYEWETQINSRYFPLGQDAILVDKKTKENVFVNLGGKTLKSFTTPSGVDSILSNMIEDEFKNSPVDVAGHWLQMVYDTGDEIIIYDRMTADIDEDIRNNVRPITYGELFYILIHKYINKARGLITRFPIATELSIYPTKVSINTTIKNRIISNTIIDEIGTTVKIMDKYPDITSKWLSGISPSTTRLPKLGLDFDGDKLAFVLMFLEESLEEINETFNRLDMYIDNNGNEIHALDNNVCKRTFKTLTRT